MARNNHGGARQGAGRIPNNRRTDRPRGQPGISQFFSRSSTSSQTTSSRTSSSTNTHTNRAQVTRSTIASSSHNTSSQNTNSRVSSSSSSHNSNASSSSSSQNMNARASSRAQNSSPSSGINNTPNYDVDEEDYANDFKRGKKIQGSVNLMKQRNDIMEDAHQKRAQDNIRNSGIFWEHPPSLVVKPIADLKHCWMEFFKLPVFNWYPQIVLGSQWKPFCPHCKNSLTKHGVNLQPRLVFGLHRNYWLNSPQRYICSHCRDRNTARNVDTDPAITYSFYDTSEEILEQIENIHPELASIFPCHLTNVNAIDKELMDLVIHSAVKGIGPGAISETIASFHELHWQKQENHWLHTLHKLLNVNQQRIRRKDIEKCPEYFTLKMGGCVPSASWLIEMFCIIVKRMRPYLDSEVIKRAMTTKILSIDASYKVIKWMMKWGSKERIYNALFTGSNEYNEIPMQFFSTSDNHEELGANFESLKKLGLDPMLVFTDDPGRDESLLKRIFPRLSNTADDDEADDDTPGDLEEFMSDKEILYLYDLDKLLTALSKFRQDLEDTLSNPDHSTVRVAFDAEWPLYITDPSHPNRKKTRGDVNIITLGSNVVNYTLVIELYNFKRNRVHMDRIGQKLKTIFMMKVDCFTGCRQKHDYTYLIQQYPMFGLPLEAKKLMDDVSLMALNRSLVKKGRGTSTLQALCRQQKLHLRKPAHVRVGTCFDSRGTLSAEALKYCQLDVEAPLHLHSIYSGIPDATIRITGNLPSVGTIVDIMPELRSATEPIAQGVVIQCGGRGSTWHPNNISIDKNQVLVQVNKVFKAKGIIHYPSTSTHKNKCNCNRGHHGKIGESCSFYLFSQFGPPPFQVLELKSRLRLKNDMFHYPQCIHQDRENAVDANVSLYERTELDEVLDPRDETNTETQMTDDDEDGAGDDGDGDEQINMSPETLQFIDGMVNDDEEDDWDESNEEASDSQVRVAMDTDFNDELQKIIEEADRISEMQNNNQQDTEDIPIEEVLETGRFKKILGDIFHFMDRTKLPMHHEYKALFFRALRASMFIMNNDDVEQVKQVLEAKGESWEKYMAFNFSYIAARVRRTVPDATILYNRMVAVFNFFKDKKDSQTGHTLFHKTNKKKFENMLEMIRNGYATDPPGLSLYILKTDKYGRQMVDRDGLKLYRSLRGTSNLESIHQYLTTSFGHTMAGPWYSDSLLAMVRHFLNWRMSLKNRPTFPRLMHYNGLLIDRVNELYELVFGYPKYRHWEVFNENLPSSSPFGIVPVSKSNTIEYSPEDKDLLSKNKMLTYLAHRQKSPIPFVPIRSVNEKKLVHQKLNQLVANNSSMGNQRVYDELCEEWNTHHINVSKKQFPKLSGHFTRYIKGWRKNQDRRDAAVTSGAERIFDALEYIPATQNTVALETTGISNPATETIQTDTPAIATDNFNPTQDPTERTVQDTPNMSALLCAVCNQATEATEEEPKRKRRKKQCQGDKINEIPCPYPDTCVGSAINANCWLFTGGDPAKKTKRTVTVTFERTCQVCGGKGCPGSQDRSECMYK